MTIVNMSDGRNFTDYRSSREAMSSYRKQFKLGDSKSLRHALTNNPITKSNCTKKEASTMSVLCGGSMLEYVSTPSNINEYPTGPLTR